ncbi:serine carboxypeptidase S28 [Trichuris suis]|nr:serine carboxypeptidase S28 [Trichuris suis]
MRWGGREKPHIRAPYWSTEILCQASKRGFIWDNAEAFNAMVVFAEHRYYGRSLPFGNMSRNMLGKLSSSQALADFALLISHLKSTFGSAVYLPVIAFGGSYGGMLAAWMRIKYPHLIDGALAASAPVAQFPGLTPCSAFRDITSEVFRNTSNSCAVSISRSWKVIRKLGATTEGRQKLIDIFKLCSESGVALKNNVTPLVNWLSDIYSTLAMVNYPYENDFLNPVPGWPVKARRTVLCNSFTFNYEPHVACNYLNNKETNGTELLEAIYKALSVYLNYTGAVACNRLESKYGSSVDVELWEYQAFVSGSGAAYWRIILLKAGQTWYMKIGGSPCLHIVLLTCGDKSFPKTLLLFNAAKPPLLTDFSSVHVVKFNGVQPVQKIKVRKKCLSTWSVSGGQKLYACLQSCTEMVMPMCSSEKSMFEKSEWNETEFAEKCFQKFGVRPSRDWAVSNYGGRTLSSVTNIVFSNGWLDPWRGGGILSSDHGIASLIVEDGAHHYDLRGHHPMDTPSVINVSPDYFKRENSQYSDRCKLKVCCTQAVVGDLI